MNKSASPDSLSVEDEQMSLRMFASNPTGVIKIDTLRGMVYALSSNQA
ncbi:MAG: hypothetical protein J6S69_01900 [Proteobacteria bacterium]|nr:hypothetical protein [Pseudomonadota bacterium]